jgi:hypothetical protein
MQIFIGRQTNSRADFRHQDVVTKDNITNLDLELLTRFLDSLGNLSSSSVLTLQNKTNIITAIFDRYLD